MNHFRSDRTSRMDNSCFWLADFTKVPPLKPHAHAQKEAIFTGITYRTPWIHSCVRLDLDRTKDIVARGNSCFCLADYVSSPPLWWGDILFLSLSVTKFVSATPPKLLIRISWNLECRTSIVVVHITGKFRSSHFCGSYAPWNLENSHKLPCQRNSS